MPALEFHIARRCHAFFTLGAPTGAAVLLATRQLHLTETTLGCATIRLCLLARHGDVVGDGLAMGTEIGVACLAAETVLPHVPCLALCQRRPVRGVAGKRACGALKARVHALENIAASGVRALDVVSVHLH